MTDHAGVVLAKNKTSRPGTPLSWVVSLIACGYCLWMGAALFFSTRTLINMYSSMGVDLSLSTKIVIAFYRVLNPIVFGGAAALVIVKQYFVREKWVNISATLGTVLVANIVSNGIATALYRPLLDLMKTLNK